MKAKIEKLIKEYDNKIELIDKSISSEQEAKRKARHNRQDTLAEHYSQNIKILNARKQAYIQTKADIDSLLD